MRTVTNINAPRCSRAMEDPFPDSGHPWGFHMVVISSGKPHQERLALTHEVTAGPALASQALTLAFLWLRRDLRAKPKASTRADVA